MSGSTCLRVVGGSVPEPPVCMCKVRAPDSSNKLQHKPQTEAKDGTQDDVAEETLNCVRLLLLVWVCRPVQQMVHLRSKAGSA